MSGAFKYLNVSFNKILRNLLTCITGFIALLCFSVAANAQTDSLVADPGHSRLIQVGTAVTLDGSASVSTAGLRLTYNWTLIQQPQGSLAELSAANSPRPSLTTDIAGDYIAELIVTDSEGNSSAAQTVLLTTNNISPVAVAGFDRVTTVGQSLRFDPEGTYDANGDRLSASWSILSYPSNSSDTAPDDPGNPGDNNQFCPVTATETLGTYHVVSATSNQQSPQLAAGAPLPEGTTETGNNSATTYYGPITMDLTGDPNIFVPAGEVLEVVLSSAWGNAARAEILVSADGQNYTSLGSVGNGGSVYGTYSSNILRYDDFTVPAGGARFLQVSHQNGGVRADGVIYNTQCQSSTTGAEPEEEEDQSGLATLTEDDGGRFEFTPNVSGNFSIQLLVEDEDGAQSTDVVSVYVAPTDGSGDPEDLNLAPVANAGLNQLSTTGQANVLDGSQSTDINGDMLTYKWSILSKPLDSFSLIENSTSARASITPDTDRTYILQLEVTDMEGLKSYDTVVLSGDFVGPNAVSGGPDARADGAISNQAASVDGSSSISGQGSGINLAYEWSVLGLSEGESEIANVSAVSTAIDFPAGASEGSLGPDAEFSIDLLSEYNLIVFTDLNSNVDTRGTTLVGGNLFGNSATFGTQIPQGQNIDALSVVGNISGGPKNINNGGNVRHGGSVWTHVNRNGGGQLINDPTLSVTSEQAGLLSLSSDLAGLTANSTAEIPNPNGRHGPARLNASPDESGVAVFDIADGNFLFRNDRVQQIEVNANGAETIIVNVGGADIDFNRGNFVGAINNDDLRRKIIWNFYDATDLFFDRAFHGTVLAPKAHLHNRTNIRGTVIVDSMLARGPIELPAFTGTGLTSGEAGEGADFALVQLAVSDTDNPNLAPSFSSTVLTTGNLRPVARITQSGGSGVLTPGIEVGFNGSASFDGDNDALTYSWSILSKPNGSAIEFTSASPSSLSATPDRAGQYVVQLVVSDGELTSKPVTLAFEAQNTAPTANAGPDQSVLKAELVVLDGSGSSDPDGDDLTYLWTFTERPQGSQAELSGETSASPEFVADLKGDYVLNLTVDDGVQGTDTDSVSVTVENRSPIAVVTGKAEGFVGDIIMLSGAGSSDPDGDVLTYSWSLQGPEGSSAAISDIAGAAPTLTADVGGSYTFTLIVNDGEVDSLPVSFTSSISDANRAPELAPIGDRSMALGSSLVLQLSGTDPDGDDIYYSATALPLPAGASFDVNTGLFTFKPASLTPESITLTFGVTDSALSDTETVTITVDNTLEVPTTEYTGRVVDVDTGEPISGVLIMAEGQTAVTGADGVFQLTDLPAGPVAIWIVANDGTELAPDGTVYGSTQIATNLIENVSNSSGSDINLSPISASEEVNSGQATVVRDEALGITMEIPKDGILGQGVLSRHWRILVNSIVDTTERTSFGEWELRAVPGGSNILSGGTITSSSNFNSSFVASNLFDGNGSTGWAAGPTGGSGDWVAYDLGEGNEVSVSEAAITARTTSFAPRQAPTDFDIQISNDGINWVTVKNFTSSADWQILETREFDLSEPYTGSVELTALTAEQANTLPPNVVPCQLFSIGPKTILVTKPITVTVNNYDKLPAGAIVDVWVFNGADFTVVGSGTVSSDASEVSAVLTNLQGGQLFALAPRPSVVNITSDQPGDTYVPGLLNEGNYSTFYSTPSYSSLGSDRALTFVYNSTAANPSPIVSSISTIVENSGTPVSISQMVKVGDALLSLESQTDLTTAPNGTESFVQAGTFDASELPTGTYPVNFMSVSQYACSQVAASTETEISINNQTQSPIGSGWSISEVSRLQVDDEGRVTLINGDGTVLEFSPEQELGSVRETFAVDVGFDFVPVVTDIDNNGTVDLVVPDAENGTLRFFLNQNGTEFIEDTNSEVSVTRGGTSLPRPAGGFSDSSPLRHADFDNDGMLEFVISSHSRNVIQIIGKVDDTYQIVNTISLSNNLYEIKIEDFDNDGFLDILAFDGSRLRFYVNDGTGQFSLASSQSRSGIDIGTDDIDGDGKVDVVVLSGSTARIRFNEGDLTVREVNVSLPRSANRFLGQLVEIGDVDLDGDNDIIVSTLPNVTYIENLGDRDFRAVELVRPAGFGNADNITLADVTGDGLLDVLVDERTPQPRYALFRKLVDGDYAPAEAVVFGHPIGESLVTDVDRDGFQDLVSKARFQLYVDFGQPPNNGNFNSPFGDFSSLVRNDDGTFSRRFTNGTVVTYSAAGLQTATTDRNGNETAYAYDADGRLLTVTDPTGQVTNLAYGPDGLLETVTDPAGRSSSFTHNDVGNLVEVRDPEDQPVRYDYDEQSRLVSETSKRDLTTVNSYGAGGRYTGSEFADGTSMGLSVARTLGLPDLGSDTSEFVPVEDRMSEVIDGRGNVTETEVNEFGSPIRVVDALGRETIYERNGNNLVTVIIQPSSVTASGTLRMEMAYDIRGNLTSQTEAVGTPLERTKLTEYETVFSRPVKITDADSFETLMAYDEFGNRIRMTDPLGGEENMTYNARGRVVTLRDKNNNLTEFEYDNFSRLSFTTDASNIRQQMVHDEAGNVIEIIDDVDGPLERSTLISYDGLNRKVNETAADGGVTTYAYDGNDNVTSVIDATGITETRSYDDRDRLEIINDPSSGATIMAYDEDNNITRMTDALGETTEFAYDAVDRLLSSVDAKGQLRAFAYDLRDNITAITDARANISHVTYDELDRPRSRSNPNSETWSFAYDLRDNRVSATKPDGTVIASIYDGLSRLTSLTGGDVARDYSYDPQSNLLAANDNLNGASGAQLGFTYDGENRVETASVANLFGAGVSQNSFTYSYDAHDRRASLVDSFSGTTSYGYDPVDRLTRVTTPQSDNFDTNYDLAGRTLGRVAPNATDMIRQYEAATGRLSSQVQRAGGATFNGFDYAYTDRGNIEGITETGDVIRDRAYSYDELERLTEVDVPTAPTQDESYTLDPEGNRLSSHLSDTHQTDAANRLTSDANYTYVYDLNGTLTSKLAKAGTGLSDWTYSYNTLDQLIEVQQDSLVVETYRYDAFGRRSLISTVEGAGLTQQLALINDGSDRAIDITQGGVGQAVPVRRYTHSANVDEPLQVETFDAAGSFDARYTYHADHLGSVRYLTDSSGAIVNAYDYDSYGRPMFGVTAFDQPFAYTGREWDQATGLYHYRARAYDAEMGRFLQEDPIGFDAGDLNVYRYVGSKPVGHTDPSGLTAVESAGLLSRTGGFAASAGNIGLRLNCIFTAIAAGIEVAGDPHIETLDIVAKGSGVALECGVKVKLKKRPKGKKDAVCPLKCFAAGTLVHTSEGLKPIEQVKIGDEVKSMNTTTGEIAYKRVTNTHTNYFDSVGLVRLQDETDGSETYLSVTATHPFYHSEKGWIHASLLSIGDKLTEDDGGTLTVTEVTFNLEAPINLTYNLEVADFHTYFVGEDGVLTHNGNGVGRILANIYAALALGGAADGVTQAGEGFGCVQSRKFEILTKIQKAKLDGKSPGTPKHPLWYVNYLKGKF